MSSEESTALKANAKIKQILEMPLATGNIYWLKQKSKGHILLARAGDYLNVELMQKFNDTHNFHLERVINMEEYLTFKSRLAAYKAAINERSRVEAMTNFLVMVRDNYFIEGKESSILSLASACFDSFQYENSDFYKKLFDLSVTLFKRALRFAAIGASYAMAIGYTDYKMVQDFYNICFYGVYGFLNDNYISSTLTTLEQSRSASACLKEFTGKELKEIKNSLDENFADNFSFDFIQNLQSYAFEKRDGSGEPNQCNEDQLSDLENIYILLSNTMSYKDLDFLPLDGKSYLWTMLKTENAVLGVFRIKKILAKRFENIKAIEKSYLEMMA